MKSYALEKSQHLAVRLLRAGQGGWGDDKLEAAVLLKVTTNEV